MRAQPWTLFVVEGFLERVLDLTRTMILAALGTSLAELTGDWRYAQSLHQRGEGPLPPSQRLGRAAYDQGNIVGLRYRSAKNVDEGVNLLVFADRLEPGAASYLEVHDPHGSILQRIPEPAE